jgi:hypothetical protein
MQNPVEEMAALANFCYGRLRPPGLPQTVASRPVHRFGNGTASVGRSTVGSLATGHLRGVHPNQTWRNEHSRMVRAALAVGRSNLYVSTLCREPFWSENSPEQLQGLTPRQLN